MMNFKTILYTSLCYLTLIACQNKNIKETIQEDHVVSFENEDKIMNDAINKALSTLSDFRIAFDNPKEGYENFAIKQRFQTPDGGGEHMWIGNLKTDGKSYIGIVQNQPQQTQEVQLGDTIKVDLDRITDWMYLDKGTLRGGYTIRVMRDQLSDQEKKDFDQETGFKIED